MKYAIKADMNGELLAGELIKTASNHPDKFTVIPDLDAITGNVKSGSFALTPKDNLGIDGLSGRTYAAPDAPFGELQILVEAFSWPQNTTETQKDEAMLSIFKPLVERYNNTHKSQARIVPKP